MKLHKGDTVIVITGKDRGKTGIVEAVFPATNRVAVTGVNSYKKHTKPTQKNPQGGIVQLFRSIEASNVMLIDKETSKPTRIGYTYEKQDKFRVSRLTGKQIGK
jgi:large subunit ribosomal protein L24